MIAELDTHDEAHRALARIVDEDPQLIGRIGILPADHDGGPAAPYESAVELLARA